MQKLRHSVLESVLNTITGTLMAMVIGHIVYPWYGFHPTVAQNFELTMVFLVSGVVRSLAWRRVFNWLHVTGLLR